MDFSEEEMKRNWEVKKEPTEKKPKLIISRDLTNADIDKARDQQSEQIGKSRNQGKENGKETEQPETE